MFFWKNDSAGKTALLIHGARRVGKSYIADSHAFDENGIVSEELYKKLLFDKHEVNKGMITENIVAQMLAATGHKLYFYSNPSRSDSAYRRFERGGRNFASKSLQKLSPAELSRTRHRYP